MRKWKDNVTFNGILSKTENLWTRNSYQTETTKLKEIKFNLNQCNGYI